jgi:glycosyltransferase involved in cell wall biosynthesis
MITPEPFFQPRGTPFSTLFRTKALCELGHRVEILAYPVGEDVDIPGLKIHRTIRLPFVKNVQIGPSILKIFLDMFIAFKSMKMLATKKYDVIHAHEEGAFFGVIFKKMFKKPLVYDMHSSIPEQLVNFKFTNSRLLINLAALTEKWIIRNSDAVIAISPSLKDKVEEIKKGFPVEVIENLGLVESGNKDFDKLRRISDEFSLKGRKVLLYTGTLEPYQGIELLIRSIPNVIKNEKDVLFLIVGGREDQITNFRSVVKSMGLMDSVIFTGQRPLSEISSFMEIADVLVSPRISGTNPPLKIYTYITSGKPIVATNLYVHTQVLDNEMAVLTEPNPEDFGEGILKVLSDRETSDKMAKKAKEVGEKRYSYESYISKVEKVYSKIG